MECEALASCGTTQKGRTTNVAAGLKTRRARLKHRPYEILGRPAGLGRTGVTQKITNVAAGLRTSRAV
jgi:hypothetical protein